MNRYIVILAIVLSSIVIGLATQSQPFIRVPLRMLPMGSGNGAGVTIEAWRRVQPEVSRFAKTITYDRAVDSDGRTVATQLHTALQAAGEKGPFVLAGWSLGGLYVRVFADMYPDEVAAIVLVDPMRHDEFDPKDPTMAATMSQAREAAIPSNVPVFLISAIGPRRDGTPYLTAADKERFDRYYMERQIDLAGHKAWLEGIPHGRLIVTENSGHMIPLEEPDLVIETIRQAVIGLKR
jgi:pimeloyl-ACP methyl ester carboxylesterase